MVGETAMVLPTNKIVYDSKNLHVQTKKVETVDDVYPGRLVKKGSNDDDIIVNTAAGAAIGWAGYEHTAKKYRPATVDTIYVANDQIAVINGPGIILNAHTDLGCTTTKGTRLKAGAKGKLSGGVVGTDEIVAIAEGTAAADSDVLVRSLI